MVRMKIDCNLKKNLAEFFKSTPCFLEKSQNMTLADFTFEKSLNPLNVLDALRVREKILSLNFITVMTWLLEVQNPA